MSPIGEVFMAALDSFPRVSGDEPFTTEDATGFEVFSPRERG